MSKPSVYFDISIDGVPSGRITMELYNDVVPETAENFRACALTRKDLDTRDPHSTASFPSS